MIPVENVYFLLCYAWGRFDEGEMVEVASQDFCSAADLLASVLHRGVSRLLRKGLDRGYLEKEEILNTIRGRIDIGYTGRHALHRRGRAMCRFDDMEHDVLHNRIIKSTIGRLICVKDLERTTKDKLLGTYRRLQGIGDIELRPAVFKRVTIHRNNRYYRFLLHVCQLLVSYLVPDEARGTYRFRDFLRDEKRMAYLFQEFVFNFLAKEQAEYAVKSDRLRWPATALDLDREVDLDLLPVMDTDISLRSPSRTLIIDTKYYAEVLRAKHDYKPKVRSEHLYQINAYLDSLETKDFPDDHADGLLLYPTNSTTVDLGWNIRGHTVMVKTIDLAQPWQNIRGDLLRIVDCWTARPPAPKRVAAAPP